MSGDWVPKSVLMISEINSLIATSGKVAFDFLSMATLHSLKVKVFFK